MKILQIYNKIPFPPKDGGSVAVYSFCETFAKLGHSVDLAAFNTSKHYVNVESIKDEIPVNLKIIPFHINTEINLFKLLFNFFFSTLPYNAERFISKAFNQLLIELLKNNTYDIIQIEGLYMMPYISTIRNNSNALVSFRAHNVEHEIWDNTKKKEKNIFKKLYLNNLFKRIYKFEIGYINTYDLMVPITVKDAEKFNTLGNQKKIQISPTGLDSSKYLHQNHSINQYRFFHLGSLDWIPNREGILWFLNNIWTEINKKYREVTFSIAGRNAPNSFVERISGYENVIYQGEIDDAIEFMHDHTIMIVPLFSGSGLRIKIIEGLACGNIIISTSKGAEGIPVTDRKHLFIADTVNDFLVCIDQILTDKYDLNEISNNAQQFISDNFDNFAVSNSLLEFYREAISRK